MKPHCQKLICRRRQHLVGGWQRLIYLPVKGKLREGTDGGVTCWDVNSPAPFKISPSSLSTQRAPVRWQVGHHFTCVIFLPVTLWTNTSKVTTSGQSQFPFYSLFLMEKVFPIKSGIIACVFSVVNIWSAVCPLLAIRGRIMAFFELPRQNLGLLWPNKRPTQLLYQLLIHHKGRAFALLSSPVWACQCRWC